MENVVYFDNASTTKVDRHVLDRYNLYQNEFFANPSSIHKLGLKAKEKLNDGRQKIANILNCNLTEIFFTSCGSESNNLILKNYKSKYKKQNKIISFTSEHASVYNTLKGLDKEIIFLNPGSKPIKYNDIKKHLDEEVYLIVVMLVNNETGIINDIAYIV